MQYIYIYIYIYGHLNFSSGLGCLEGLGAPERGGFGLTLRSSESKSEVPAPPLRADFSLRLASAGRRAAGAAEERH